MEKTRWPQIGRQNNNETLFFLISWDKRADSVSWRLAWYKIAFLLSLVTIKALSNRLSYLYNSATMNLECRVHESRHYKDFTGTQSLSLHYEAGWRGCVGVCGGCVAGVWGVCVGVVCRVLCTSNQGLFDHNSCSTVTELKNNSKTI